MTSIRPVLQGYCELASQMRIAQKLILYPCFLPLEQRILLSTLHQTSEPSCEDKEDLKAGIIQICWPKKK